jgi:TolB-like protein
MVTGRRAFRKDSTVQTLSAIIEEDPVPIASIQPNISDHLRAIVGRCLAKNANDRYDSTRDLEKEIRGVHEEPPSKSHAGFDKSTAVIDSVAVLPFANLSSDPEQDYFVDGMTEALITDLAKIDTLKVISRTSVMRYRDANKPLPEIAQELGVDAIVEGSVHRAGNRVRVTAQLIHAVTDQHLWAERYQRDVDDIFSLQSDLAQSIAREIKVKLTPKVEARLATKHEVEPQIYELYLKGRQQLFTWSEEGLTKGIQYLEEAIRKDPDYAPPYAELANTFNTLACFGTTPPIPFYEKAKAAALRALDLDEAQAEAEAALATLKLVCERDWVDAEERFRRAIEHGPNAVLPHTWYGDSYLPAAGRYDEAIHYIERALELDPLNPTMRTDLGGVLFFKRHFDEAIAQVQKAIVM